MNKLKRGRNGRGQYVSERVRRMRVVAKFRDRDTHGRFITETSGEVPVVMSPPKVPDAVRSEAAKRREHMKRVLKHLHKTGQQEQAPEVHTISSKVVLAGVILLLVVVYAIIKVVADFKK